jgi:hypothetical protein
VLRLLALGSIAVAARSFALEVLRGVGRPGLTTLAELANWLLFVAAVTVAASAGGLLGAAAAVAAVAWAGVGVLVLLLWRVGMWPRVVAAQPACEAWEAA